MLTTVYTNNSFVSCKKVLSIKWANKQVAKSELPFLLRLATYSFLFAAFFPDSFVGRERVRFFLFLISS